MNSEIKITGSGQEAPAEAPTEEMHVLPRLGRTATGGTQESREELPEDYFDGMPFAD